jgi:hypothetical protein
VPLQRRITDFGADVPFGKVSEKLTEHYGITVPYSAARDITEKHARHMKNNEMPKSTVPDAPGVGCVIAETDGTMIPVADTADGVIGAGPSDRRKTRKGRWKEARLTLSHAKGSVNPRFGCTLGGPDEAGDRLADCAIRSGLGQNTQVHCVGDGAPWIFRQVNRVFGAQAEFLIDFYHLCEYLSSASKICAPDDYPNFFGRQKRLMKENRVSAVLEELQPHIEPDSVPDEKAPVRSCYRYIGNRQGQFDYKGASEKGLPVGSGEIESAHRYIIQKRLKISGAWWKEDNAENMIALRVLRANKEWEDYWKNNKVA